MLQLVSCTYQTHNARFASVIVYRSATSCEGPGIAALLTGGTSRAVGSLPAGADSAPADCSAGVAASALARGGCGARASRVDALGEAGGCAGGATDTWLMLAGRSSFLVCEAGCDGEGLGFRVCCCCFEGAAGRGPGCLPGRRPPCCACTPAEERVWMSKIRVASLGTAAPGRWELRLLNCAALGFSTCKLQNARLLAGMKETVEMLNRATD